MNIAVGIQRGASTPACPLTEDLLKADSRPLEAPLRHEPTHFPSASIAVEAKAYFDPQIAALEKEVIWKKSWQMVGRVEDIPEVGDRFPFDVAGLSYIIVRSAPDRVKALQNSCTHRGTRLCNAATTGSFFRCPFHGWQWNLDGKIEDYRARWDFTHIRPDDFHLPEAKVEVWGGFIFINPDPDAGPLKEALGVLADHFTSREGEDRYTALHIRKKLRCNWKIAVEAFLETYHSPETHPDTNGYHGAEASKYDIWDDGKSHVSRLIMVMGVPPVHRGDELSRREASQELTRNLAFANMTELEPPNLTSDETCRSEVAEWWRNVLGKQFKRDYSACSDSYMIDGIQYFMFPQFFPWWGEAFPLMYQMYPIGNNPAECMAEFRLLLPKPIDGSVPDPVDPIDIDFDSRFVDVPELQGNTVWKALTEDLDNMAFAQLGLEGRYDPSSKLQLSRYQDSRIVHFHEVIQAKLAAVASPE